jgi:hypothetical protein
MKFLLAILLIPFLIQAQDSTEADNYELKIEKAYKNAMKGVYWALDNIPDSKSKISKDLISEDKLISEVSLEKEVNGVRIEAKGFHDTYEIEIKLYRSNDSLRKEGHL